MQPAASTPIIDPLAAVPPPIVPQEDDSLGTKLKRIPPRQYVALGAITLVVAIGVGFLANITTFSGDIRSRASNADLPEATPMSCSTTCSDTAPCPGALKCYDGVCRNPSCWGSSTCICAPMPGR